MSIRNKIKTIGRLFITLKQRDEKIISQSILVIDNGYCRMIDLNTAIKRVQIHFPKAEISILTFEDRKSALQEGFPTLKFTLLSERITPKKYRIALQLLTMKKSGFDLIVLFSLDITPLISALLFHKSKVALYNQYGQWFSLRLRNISEIFKNTYVQQKVGFSFKKLLKMTGLFFILLQRKDEGIFEHSILIVDNGYALLGQIDYIVRHIKESLPFARVALLVREERRDLENKFPGLETIISRDFVIKKYRLARQMLRLRSNEYDYIILLSLDITPLVVSILFTHSRSLLNNQWHQWWLVGPKSMTACLMAIPKFIMSIIFNIIVFIYLLISVSWLFLLRSFNVFKSNLLSKRE